MKVFAFHLCDVTSVIRWQDIQITFVYMQDADIETLVITAPLQKQFLQINIQILNSNT